MEGCPFDVNPFDQSETIKKPNIFNLVYTNQDFSSLKTRLADYIRQNFSDEFNDFSESSLAIMLMEIWAFLGDTLSFKMDQIVNEIFIDTVTEVENIFRHAKFVGFSPQAPIAARAMFTATINNALLSDVIIPAPLDIDIQSGGQSITYELYPADSSNKPIFDQDIVIPAGNLVNASIVGLEGSTRRQESIGTGESSQTILLRFRPVVWDSVRVNVDGVRWTQVDYFTDSQPRREYRVEFDSNYNGYVIFGTDRAGLIPQQGSRIEITYRIGGGTAGNITTGFIETQTIVSVEGLDFSVPVSLRNYTKGEYGYNGDTLEDVRRKLPAWNRRQLRAVTGLDYKVLADQFATPYNGQVGKSTAVLRNHGCAGNVIDLYILAKSGINQLASASSQLKEDLYEELDENKMFTDTICIRDGIIVSTDVSIDVTVDKFYRKFEDELRERINRRTGQFFSLNNWDFNKDLRESDLIKSLSDIREVERFDITFVTNNAKNSGSVVTTKYNEIVRPDTIEITFIYE